MSRLFERRASPTKDRINALDELQRAGIKTYAMIAPMLPGSADILELLEEKVDYVLIGRINRDINYCYAIRGILLMGN